MSGPQPRPDSLAAQAAAWVPPWERDGTAAGATPADQPPSAEADATSDAEPAGAPEPAEPADLTPGEPADTAPDAMPDAAADTMPDDLVDVSPRVRAGEPALGQVDGGDAALNGGGVAAAEDGAGTGAPEDGAGTGAPEDGQLKSAIEAILLVVDEPVSEVLLAQVLHSPTARVTEALEELATEYATGRRGFELRRAAGGWRLYTRSEFAPYVERFILDGQQLRLTQAALEALAVVAYKQPVTRSRIGAIRGVNSDGVVRTLVTRGLIEECGTEQETGAYLYRTTPLFLEKLGLDSIAELPPLAPFLPDDVDEVADGAR